MKMNSRNISDGDADCIKTLFYEHGINDWNSFDDREINDQISLVNKGLADAVLLEGERILGVAFIVYGVSCPAKLEKYHDLRKISFVKDVVVRDWDLAPVDIILSEVGGCICLLNGDRYLYSGSYEKENGFIIARDKSLMLKIVSLQI